MHILLVNNAEIPVKAYGGAERIVWWLGKALVKMGHEVTYLVKKKSTCPFAKVLWLDESRPLAAQIPAECDLVHLHFPTQEILPKPVIFTCHTNAAGPTVFHPNTVFLSRDHAKRHGAKVFVYNGLDFEDYGEPMLDNRRMYLHFLGKAEWRVKNVKGAIELADKVGERIHVIGGTRVNFRAGLRITLSSHVRFHGMVGGDGKNVLINGSKGLLYPTLWHEPFGLAIIESLWFGCPVFGTPYGSLPELLSPPPRNHDDKMNGTGQIEALYSEWGCLSTRKSELVEALKEAGSFNRKGCHDFVRAYFSAGMMAAAYIHLYEKVLSGYPLHPFDPHCLVPQQGKLLPFK